MRRPNSIHAQSSQSVQPPFPHSKRYRGTKRAPIVVQAGPFDFEVFAVEPESGIRVEMKFADSKGYGFAVKRFPIGNNAYNRPIHCRPFETPEFRFLDKKIKFNAHPVLGVDGSGPCLGDGNYLSRRV